MENIAKDWQLSEYFETLLQDMIHTEEEKILETLQGIEHNIMIYMKSPFTVFDPAHGEIQMEYHLPFPVYSLDVLPVTGDLSRVYERIQRQVPSLRLPMFHQELLPPFSGK